MKPARAIVLGAGLALLPTAQAQLSADQSVSAAGGGTSSAGPYALIDTIGAEPVGESSSATYAVKHGFHSTLNLPPVVRQDTLLRSVAGGKIRVASLLENDLDPDGDALTIGSVASTGTGGGSVTIDGGWLLYVPPVGWNGSDLVSYTVADADGHRSTGTVLVQPMGAGLTAPNTIVRLQVLPDGARSIGFAGIAGRSYSIQATSDLSQPVWTELTLRLAGPNGLFEFVDSEQPPPAQRYYRAMSR